ncbi:MAG: T9SS type A sorting domain-containing protein [Saprospiraceae bacterium]
MQPYGIFYKSFFFTFTFIFGLSFSAKAQGDPLQIDTILTTPVTCFGGDNGEAQVLFSGGTEPYVILWSDGQEGALATDLEPGVYTVTITDAMGEEVSGSAEIGEPPLMTMTSASVNPICPDDETGSVTIDPSGGVPPYTIYWSNSQTGPVLSNVPAGIYFVFVIDQQGCVLSEMFILQGTDSEPPLISASPSFLYLDESGEIPLTPALLNIQVSDNCGISGINIDPPVLTCQNAGTNTLTLSVVDQSNNISSIQVTVSVIDTISPVLPSDTLHVELGPDGTVTVDPQDLAASATDNCEILFYEVTPSTFDCQNIDLNEVTVTITDQSGNSVSTQSYVFVEDKLPPVVLAKDITVTLDANGQASIVADQIDEGSSDNCGFFSKQATPNHFSCEDIGSPVEVTLKITDLHGNSATAIALVTVADGQAPVIECPEDIQIEFCGPVEYDMPTGSDNCEFTITQTGGLGSGSIFPFGVNTETFTATDAYGNETSCSFDIIVENDFLVTEEVQPVTCFGDADGSIELTVSGGLPPYAYIWSGGSNLNLQAGGYDVTIFDSNGCESIYPFEITGPDEVTVQVVDILPENQSQQNGGFTLIVTGGTPPFVFDGMTFSGSLIVSGYSAGNYSVTITDQNGCQGFADFTIGNVNSTGEPEVLRQFAVFPNPAKDYAVANVRLANSASMQLSLTDFTGRTLRSWPAIEANGYTFSVDLSGLPAGVYTLLLQLEGGEVVGRKLVKGEE